MSYVRVADKIKQLNDANFFLLDAKDIEVSNGLDLETVLDELHIDSFTLGWEQILNKPFNSISSDFIIDNDILKISSSLFDETNLKINYIISELDKKAIINDSDVSSIDTTWSAYQIKSELDKKASMETNHKHDNLSDVLDKLSVDANRLIFDSKTLMETDIYDKDNDGIVDKSKSAETIEGLLSTIEEINYLQGVKSNIQNQIDSLSSGVEFKGEHDTYQIMIDTITSPSKGYWVYIINDEKTNQTNTQYVYDGNEWVYGGGRTSVNDATQTSKGIIQLSGDLTGTAISPQLINITTEQSIGYIKAITIDTKGRVTSITEDTTLSQRIADLESRPQIYISETRPETLKNGDIWIEG